MAAERIATGYATEALARIHDEGFGHHARGAADLLVRRLASAGHRDGLVVDLGSGSGILAERLLAAGYAVRGVDRSRAMTAIARRRAPGARFTIGSFVDADIPPCVAVASIGEVMGYAFDPRAGRDALRALFARVRVALAPRGVFLFDLRGPGVRDSTGFYEGDGWSIAVRTAVDGAAGTLERDQVFFWREGECWRRARESHLLHLHDPGEVERDLRAAGFRVRRVRTYGERPFPPGLTGFVASV